MSIIDSLQCRGGGTTEMSLMQRLESSSRPSQSQKNNKRKAQPPRNPPAPKRQKANNGASVPRPQRAAAAAYSSGQHTGEAKVYRSGRDTCRIVHRELLSSITGTAGFTIPQTIPLNPGLSSFAPWLSTQAQAWERYRFNKLRFCYYTRTGSNTAGSFMMAPDFDAADAAPISESIASSYECCEEDAPWKDICCTLPQRNLMGDMKEKYIRSGPLQPNQDIKTYDAGNLFVITVDGVDAAGWGKLWVEYDVTLYTPQVPSGGFQESGTLRGTGTLTPAAPFGSGTETVGPISISANNLVLTLSSLQIGQEICVTLAVVGTGITAFLAGPTAGATTRTAITALTNAANTQGTSTFTCRVTAQTATVTISSLTATTITNAYAIVSALAPAPNF